MSAIAIKLENFLLQLLGTADITSRVNSGLTIVLFLLVLLGEANILIPVLIESLWLIVGYQSGTNTFAALHTLFLFLVAQSARQLGMLALYHLVAVINGPILRLLYRTPLAARSFYRKHIENHYLYDLPFLSTFTVTLGMLTPLSTPLKIILMLKRRLKMLLLGTLLSGAAFDVLYILLGAVFHTTKLQLTYLPLFLLAGFVAFALLKFRERRQHGVLR